MQRFSDRAGSADGSRITPPAMLPSAHSDSVGTPKRLISRLNSPACRYPCQRFAAALADDDAWLGATVVSLLLRCRTLPFLSPCRFIPAL